MTLRRILFVKRFWHAWLGVSLASAALSPGIAAAVSCGANLTVDTVLGGNLTCTTNPALTVTSAVLDLNGYTVKSTTGDGINLAGTGAELFNGVVLGKGYGVSLLEGGKHSVHDVVTKGNSQAGFGISSGGNTLENNTSLGNTNSGFLMFNTKNKLVNNVAAGNTQEGIEAGLELANKLTGNIVTGNEKDGIVIIGSNNKLKGNVVTSNALGLIGYGIRITGTGNSLKGDRVFDNYDGGVEMLGSSNKITKVTAIGNGGSGIHTIGDSNKILGNLVSGGNPGISIEGSKTQVSSCRVFASNPGIHLTAGSLHIVSKNFTFGNDGDGIQATANASRIQGNSSGGNFGDDLFDLNPACGDNIWTNNIYGTGTPSCVQ